MRVRRLQRPLIFIASISLIIYAILFIFQDEVNSYRYPHSPINCYRKSKSSNIESPPERSIFFHETSCRSYEGNNFTLTSRQACAVESAAKLHPHRTIYVFHSSPANVNYSNKFIKAVMSYPNVKISQLNFGEFLKGSPVEKLYTTGHLERSRYAVSHASDLLRYVTLWKYGGIYLDLDVVVVRSLDELHENCAGVQDSATVAVGIVGFSKTGDGHKMVEDILLELSMYFSGTKWGMNGPVMMTRLVQRLCETKNILETSGKTCKGFHVYPKKAFYAVPYERWRKIFLPKSLKQSLKDINDSYIVHTWNKYGCNTTVKVEANVLYAVLARKYCPKVFGECQKYF